MVWCPTGKGEKQGGSKVDHFSSFPLPTFFGQQISLEPLAGAQKSMGPEEMTHKHLQLVGLQIPRDLERMLAQLHRILGIPYLYTSYFLLTKERSYTNDIYFSIISTKL